MTIIIKELENSTNEKNLLKKFLFNQIKREYHYGYNSKYHQDIMNLNKYYINPKRSNFFIAKENDKIIGSIGVRGYDKYFKEFKNIYTQKTTASIWRLFVDENYRRCGIATKLFQKAEKFSHDQRYDEIYLHTHKTLPNAMSFWKKMGFNITLDCNNELKTVHMEKKINFNNY